MRLPARQSRRQKLSPATVAAPVGGWNARDSIARMPASDAVVLDNFFPVQEGVMLRKGSASFATVPAGRRIQSLLPYQKSNGDWQMFAGTSNGIFDVTPGGVIASSVSASTNGEWLSTLFSNSAGNFVWMCNGVDKARYYNGTSWTVLDNASTPALTGIVSTDVTNVFTFKSRIYLCEKDSLSFWYLPVDAVAGAASEFPLGSVFTRGGYLMALGAWTLDGGDGPEDYFVAISSEGELAIYAGSDPSNAATWSLQGLYYIAEPIGRNCLAKYGGDILAITTQGLIPISKALQSPVVDSRVGITDKISRAWIKYVQDYQNLFGWQVILNPKAPFVLVNVPESFDDAAGVQFSYQFVMNIQTGAWCRFAGMSGEAWCYVGQRLFFASFNQVNEAWVGDSDVGDVAIDARCKTAFMYPSKSSRNSVKLLRPIVDSSVLSAAIQLGIDHDYKDTALSGSETSFNSSLATWDSAIWDSAVWAQSEIISQWRSVNHIPGRALALRLRFIAKGVSMTWLSTDFLLEQGGLF